MEARELAAQHAYGRSAHATSPAGNSVPAGIRWPCVALGAGSTAVGALLARELG
jgi:hypothetical protein